MKLHGINRVVILVKDIEKAVDLYSKLFNTTFKYTAADDDGLGVRAALNFDAGVEIVSPVPGSDAPFATGLSQHIKEHGEGIFSVMFSVDNADEARDRAQDLGLRVVTEMRLNEDELEHHGMGDRFKTFIEYMFDAKDTFGANIVLGQFDPK